MSGAIPLLPLFVLFMWTGITLLLPYSTYTFIQQRVVSKALKTEIISFTMQTVRADVHCRFWKYIRSQFKVVTGTYSEPGELTATSLL
jgi:hypothetical protein